MKIIVLISAVSGCIILYVLFNTRTLGLCDFGCSDWVDKTQNTFLFFPLILLFSLVTYKMRDNLFKYWWKFARIAIPVILILSTLINLQLHHRSGGLFNMDNILDIPALVLMYAVFVIGSVIQIARGYQSK